jgi:hypothetical protein
MRVIRDVDGNTVHFIVVGSGIRELQTRDMSTGWGGDKCGGGISSEPKVKLSGDQCHAEVRWSETGVRGLGGVVGWGERGSAKV